MKNGLLLIAVVAALVVGAPAYSQFIFMDVDGDMLNQEATAIGNDGLNDTVTGVDIWLDTSKNRNGTNADCASDPLTPLSVVSYEFLIGQSGSGTVAFTGYATADPAFSTSGIPGDPDGFLPLGSEAYVYLLDLTVPFQAEGKFKLGRLSITVTGTPKLDFKTTGTTPSATTSFGSECTSNISFGQVLYMGTDVPPLFLFDWHDANGTSAATPVSNTTWGKIKNLYR